MQNFVQIKFQPNEHVYTGNEPNSELNFDKPPRN